MSDSFVQVAPNQGGAKIDNSQVTVGANDVQRQRVNWADPTDPLGLAAVKASTPASTDYGGVVRPLIASARRSDTFTGTTTGSTVTPPYPFETFSLQVVPTGAVTSWTVVLEGSIDGGTTFTTILTHTNATPGGSVIIFSGAGDTPVDYFRARCTALVLGSGTNVISTILGK